MLDKDSSSALDAVANNLGIVDAVEMFEYALPRIMQRKEDLCGYIANKDWVVAGQCSHKLISSVRLYGSEALEDLLRQITLASNNEIDPIWLEQQLSMEFDKVIAGLKQWLKLNSN